jgi:hypothetical protein
LITRSCRYRAAANCLGSNVAGSVKAGLGPHVGSRLATMPDTAVQRWSFGKRRTVNPPIAPGHSNFLHLASRPPDM